MSFFELSKILGFLLDPLNVIFLAVLSATLLLWRGRRSAALRLLALVCIVCIVILAFPISHLLLTPLEQRFPIPNPAPEKVDGVIMLGGAQQTLITRDYGQPAMNRHAERMTTFLELARKYPNAKLVFSGGSGLLLHQDVSEADVVRLFLKEQGFDPDRVMYESKSRNTYENAALSKSLATPKPNETWLLVTSAAHLPRSVGIFRSIGWDVVPMPCDYQARRADWGPSFSLLDSLQDIRYAAHEWIGLIVYYVTGKTEMFLPEVK